MLNRAENEALEQYLANRVFSRSAGTCVQSDSEITSGFAAYMSRYKIGLAVEHAAINGLRK